MTVNVINQTPYLRTSREFPEEMHQLAVEVNRSYLDIAGAVNNRTISLYPTTRSAITGESYYIENNRRQQTLRQVYTFTSTSSIDHGIKIIEPSQFTHCFGSYTNGTNSFGLLFGTSVAVAGLISFYITSSQIVFLTGAGAPALTSGIIVLHWLSQP